MNETIASESLRRPTRREQRLLIGIVLVYILVLVAAPIGALLMGAFRGGLAPVISAIGSFDFIQSFVLSLEISAIVVVAQLVFGTLVAWVMARQEFWGKYVLNGLVEFPFAVSPVVVGYILLLLFGRSGRFAPLLQQFDIRVAFAFSGMVLATLFVTLPFMIREMIPAIKSLDRDQENAAATLGASPWQTFRAVTFPALRTALVYGVTLTLARSLGEFGAVLVIGGGVQGQTETATLYVFRGLEERQYVEAYSAAIVLGICSAAVVAAADLLRRRRQRV